MPRQIQPQILSVHDALNEDQYIIPIYQRNYAWTGMEIEQLLTDIYHQFKTDDKGHFYMGTLTVMEHDDAIFEIIDGQQRHTTLNLIKAVVRHDFPTVGYGKSLLNLGFEAREISDKYFHSLIDDFSKAINQSSPEVSIHNLQHACRDIRRFLNGSTIATTEKQQYLDFLFRNVMIIRVPVPIGTDLNHYFEIMNSRGEQLEQHEILKAEFIGALKDHTETTRRRFAEIWDGCAQMDRYIQLNFDPKKRVDLFGDTLTAIKRQILLITDDSELPSDSDNSENKLIDILQTHITANTDQADPNQVTLRFRSIIDFPNFLLQVLQQLYPAESISLDDKNLLKEFGCVVNAKRQLPDPIEFINSLFHLRLCFDRYIIKREEGGDDWNWKVLQFQAQSSTYVNSFPEQKELVMIQSMFHVTQPANTYKTWLVPLMALFKCSEEINANQLIVFLQDQATAQFNVYEKNLDQGTQTPLFCFNFLDYKLWRIYYRLHQNLPVSANHLIIKQINQILSIFQRFRFIQNNSVEHVFPQHPMDDESVVERLDDFGNLCLISRSSNSRLINLPFKAKQDYFTRETRTAVESLKQAIIFTYDKWTDEEIEKHGTLMKTVLVEGFVN